MPAAQQSGRDLKLRQLLPDAGAIGLGELVDALEFRGAPPPDRPYTIVNFVSSADGRAAFRGRSGPIAGGDEADRALFLGLRERVDAVLAGTGTLRTERYGRLLRDPERRERRVASGLEPEPLACVLTRSGDVPTGIPLFAEPEARIVVFTPTQLDTSACAAQVGQVLLDPGELTLTTMMRRLRSDYAVRALLCEGGPTIFGALLDEELVDELFLTLAPRLVGGGASPTIAAGAELTELCSLGLISALERGGALYLRYAL
jgi:riboflavin biosynthesis pyrimidine reductase